MCWHRGCTGRADLILIRGRSDTGSWCWYTWQVLKSIGREVDWDVEHVGGVLVQRDHVGYGP